MGMPSRLDLKIYRGDTFSITLRFVAATDGLPIDLTGRTYASQIRVSPNAEPLTAFAVDTSQLIVGDVTISLPAASTALLANDAVWDFQETSGGEVRTLVAGALMLTKDVTHL